MYGINLVTFVILFAIDTPNGTLTDIIVPYGLVIAGKTLLRGK